MSGNAGSKTPMGIFRAAPGDNGREPDSCVATAPNADGFPAAAAATNPPDAARKLLRLREPIVELETARNYPPFFRASPRIRSAQRARAGQAAEDRSRDHDPHCEGDAVPFVS